MSPANVPDHGSRDRMTVAELRELQADLYRDAHHHWQKALELRREADALEKQCTQAGPTKVRPQDKHLCTPPS